MSPINEENSIERWLPAPGFEASYEVSSLGRVRGKKTQKVMKVQVTWLGYEAVSFFLSGKVHTKKVHRLVALAFIPNEFVKPDVNHKDGVKTNNTVSNLEWSTEAENIRHAWRMNLIKKREGVAHPRSKLLVEDVEIIRSPINLNGIQLANLFNVSPSTISLIKCRKSYR